MSVEVIQDLTITYPFIGFAASAIGLEAGTADGPPSDLFSLCVVVFEAELSGRRNQWDSAC